MKIILLLCVIFGVYQNWPTQTGGYSENNEVILYSTDWCGYCKKARQLLDSENIAYTEFDIEKSDEGLRRYDALNGNGVPVLDINGNIVKGYSKSKILHFLN